VGSVNRHANSRKVDGGGVWGGGKKQICVATSEWVVLSYHPRALIGDGIRLPHSPGVAYQDPVRVDLPPFTVPGLFVSQ
jgi:hypothetical protein